MKKEDVIKSLKINCLFSIFSIIIVIVAFETGLLIKGALAGVMSATATYILQTADIMLTVLLIPLTIKGFTNKLTKSAGMSEEKYIKLFVKKSVQRIFLLFVVLIVNVFTYYGINYEGALYCGLFALASIIYSFPTMRVMDMYLEKNKEAGK